MVERFSTGKEPIMSDLLKDKSGALADDDLKDVAGGRVFHVRRPFFFWNLFRKNDLVFRNGQPVVIDDLVSTSNQGVTAQFLGGSQVQCGTEQVDSDMIET